jgi:MFS family permease
VSGAGEPAGVQRRSPRVDATQQLRRDRDFRRYWSAHVVSTAGSAISLVVLPILMFQRTRSPLLTALLDVTYTAPYVLLGVFVGPLAERVDRRRLMIGCEWGSAVAMLSIPISSALGVLTVAQLFIAATVVGILFVGFDAAQFGALPLLFGRNRLVVATIALGSVDSALAIAGTAVGGVLATTIGAAPAVGVDAVSFVVSGLLLATVRGTFNGARAGATDPERRWRTDIAEGVRFLWNQRIIRALTLAGSAAALTGGAVTGLLVVFAVRQLGVGAHDPRIGLLFSAGAIGALLATVLTPRLTRRYDIPRLNLVSRTASLVLAVVLALLGSFIAAALIYVLFNIADFLAIRSSIAYRQLNTPDHLQGRVNVIGRMTALAGEPIGAALGGVIAEYTGVRTALLVLCLGLTLSTIGGWLGPLGRARTS